MRLKSSKTIWKERVIFSALFLFSILSLSFSALPSFASGVLYTRIGDTVELRPTDTNSNFTYSWILKKGEEVIPQSVARGGAVVSSGQTAGQTASNAAYFQHTFVESGEYTVSLLRSDRATAETQTTNVTVIASVNNPDFSADQALLRTLPPQNAEGQVILSGLSGEVVFMTAESSGDIEAFQIDADIAADSDGDGIADNDVDNQNSPSFFTGQAWAYVYSKEKPRRIAELTVRFGNGTERKASVEIIFDSAAEAERAAKPLQAVLETMPPADQSGIIHLTGEQADVTFFSGNSEGQISEYRIDKNTKFDSDGDGNPANDIDNSGTASFRSGSSWKTNFEQSWGDIIVELLVVGPDRKGSRVQRQIVFGAAESGANQSGVKLIASRNDLFAGENVDFTLLGLPEGAIVAWDFDGDGVAEDESGRTKNSYRYDAAGEFPMQVKVTKDGQEIAKLEQIVTVKDRSGTEIQTEAPTASFVSSGQDSTFSFTNSSAADSRLLNSELISSWDFGDGSTSDAANPQHTFPEVKTYTVVLTVTDSVGRSSTTAQNIEVKTLSISSSEPGEGENEPTPSETETPQGSTSDQEGSSLGWLWVTLFILALPFLVAGGYLVLRKIQLPDLTFAEILHHDLEKIKTRFGAEKTSEPSGGSPTATTVAAEIPVAPESAVVPEAQTPEWIQPDATPVTETPTTPSEAPLAQADSAPPPWLQPDAAPGPIASVAEENVPQATAEPVADPNVPDWLQATEEPSDTSQVSTSEAPSAAIPEAPSQQPASAAPVTDDVPDWLKTDFDPSGSTPPAETPETTPDWLNTPSSEDSTSAATATSNEAVPDWLSAPLESTTRAGEDTSAASTPPAPPAADQDIPDWLKDDSTANG